MGFKTGWIRYGERTGYLAYPERARPPLPGVVVVQEAWGVDVHIRDVTERFARAGYVALAPDLYAQNGERPAALAEARIAETVGWLNQQPHTMWTDPKARDEALQKQGAELGSRIRETFGAIMGGVGQLSRFVPDLVAAAGYLRDECEMSRGGKVGALGFCMGGGLAGLLAAHDPQLAGAVVFYGSHVPDDLVQNLRCPLLVLHGGQDQRLVSGLPAYEEKLKAANKAYDLHVYEGAPHAFFNDNRPSYTASAARNAFARALDFLDKQLG